MKKYGDYLSKLEKINRALKDSLKEHTQSKVAAADEIIQDLNKEIEFHDKVLDLLKRSVSDKALVDQSIMDALSSGRKLERQFMLREELLEEIKKSKQRQAVLQKKIER